jgi:pyruvate/2-oxoglutarate dehydrogenase complex dihydrolipoamide dehydrogenase (E3) component
MNRRATIQPDTPENRVLIENVRPFDWVNPEPASCYNLVVIGAGTAGLICAAGAAGLGAKVAIIERHLMGGDCLNVGCVPSKGMISASRVFHSARNSSQFGVFNPSSSPDFDFGVAMERMRRLRADISHHDSARRFRDELGVDVFFGQGSFSSPETVEVAGKTLRFNKAAVCTGARASAPSIPGLDEAGYLTSETVFTLTELPPRMAVIGAGPIGCEMAQSFARFGSRVTLIELGSRILGREDSDAARILHDTFVRDGIDLQLGVNINGVEKSGCGRILHIERDGKRIDVTVDAILAGVGRTPNLDELRLEKAGIKFDRSGVAVNDMLQTSNPNVYAAGDICTPFKFTHIADSMARCLIANALFMGRQKVSSFIIPWCTYTDPEIAHVGMYERDAKEKGIELTTFTAPLSDIDRAVLDGEAEGFARVHLRRGTDKILGATIVARHAGEMISEFSLAITNGLGISAIGKTIHPYPTQAEVVKRLADAYNRTRLTPFVKGLLSGWLKWRRY